MFLASNENIIIALCKKQLSYFIIQSQNFRVGKQASKLRLLQLKLESGNSATFFHLSRGLLPHKQVRPGIIKSRLPCSNGRPDFDPVTSGMRARCDKVGRVVRFSRNSSAGRKNQLRDRKATRGSVCFSSRSCYSFNHLKHSGNYMYHMPQR
jgi:hypothetical protein